jgi:hypothetical protein
MAIILRGTAMVAMVPVAMMAVLPEAPSCLVTAVVAMMVVRSTINQRTSQTRRRVPGAPAKLFFGLRGSES